MLFVDAFELNVTETTSSSAAFRVVSVLSVYFGSAEITLIDQVSAESSTSKKNSPVALLVVICFPPPLPTATTIAPAIASALESWIVPDRFPAAKDLESAPAA